MPVHLVFRRSLGGSAFCVRVASFFDLRIVILYERQILQRKEGATIMKKILLKVKSVLGMLIYYLFGKISNGLLFILVGSVGLMLGCVFCFPLAIVLGAAVAVSGLVLSFFRENRYIDAVKEIKHLKREQRDLKESIRLLSGKIDLLELDMETAQQAIRNLKSMKMVEYSVDGERRHVAKGKYGPAFSEHNTDDIG